MISVLMCRIFTMLNGSWGNMKFGEMYMIDARMPLAKRIPKRTIDAVK
jgi:hypothetical protein